MSDRMLIRICMIWAALSYGCQWLCAQALIIQTEELPWAVKGDPYYAEVFAAVNGACPKSDVRLRVTSGVLPKGVQLFSFGLQGTPESMGKFRFSLRADNGCVSYTRALTLLVTGKPILIVSPRHVVFEYHAGGLDAAEDVIKVEGSWPNLPYSMIVSTAPWLTALPSEGKTPDLDSAFTGDRVRLHVDPAHLAAGIYHATLKFYAQGGENAPTVDVSLQVYKAD